MDIPALGAAPDGAPLADGVDGNISASEQRQPTVSPKELGLLIVRYADGEAARGVVRHGDLTEQLPLRLVVNGGQATASVWSQQHCDGRSRDTGRLKARRAV